MLFSRSDRRIGRANLSRIDRFYVDPVIERFGGSIGILAGTSFSDHALFILYIEESHIRGDARRVRIPDDLLEEESMVTRVEEIWRELQWAPGQAARTVALRLQRVSSFLHESTQYRLDMIRETKRHLRAGLASLQHLQEHHPECSDIASQLAVARAEL